MAVNKGNSPKLKGQSEAKTMPRVADVTIEQPNDYQWANLPYSAIGLNVNRLAQNIALVCVLVLLLITFFYHVIICASIIFLNCFYVIVLLPKVYYFLVGCYYRRRDQHFETWLVTKCNELLDTKSCTVRQGDHSKKLSWDRLPMYTILLPVFHENINTLRDLLLSLSYLHYPVERLEIFMLTEADDEITQSCLDLLQQEHPIDYTLVVVPKGVIQTKPRACNYGLRFAKGKYLVIYDAEDRPEANQLLKSVLTFQLLELSEKETDHKVMCLQAELAYYNRKDNWLTKSFALEYGIWFGYMLRGLSHRRTLIPLGGTSNHFQTAVLRKVGGWDSYNVTEDADLGVRLKRLGYRVQILTSYTMEEAPNGVYAWLRQRSRWIKGFMQTYLVHWHKNSKVDARHLSWIDYLNFQLLIGSPIVIFALMPLMLLLSYLLKSYAHEVILEYPWIFIWSDWNYWFTFVILCIMSVVVVRHHNWHRMFWSMFTMPFYYFLHTLASFLAAKELFTLPFYWQKTDHGASRNNWTKQRYKSGKKSSVNKQIGD